jgi:hypothetical protein
MTIYDIETRSRKWQPRCICLLYATGQASIGKMLLGERDRALSDINARIPSPAAHNLDGIRSHTASHFQDVSIAPRSEVGGLSDMRFEAVTVFPLGFKEGRRSLVVVVESRVDGVVLPEFTNGARHGSNVWLDERVSTTRDAMVSRAATARQSPVQHLFSW